MTAAPTPDRETLLATFSARLEAADGVVHRCPDARAALGVLGVLARADRYHHGGFVDPAAEALAPGLTDVAELRPLAPDTDTAALADAAIVVTGALALVADTGSVLLCAGPTPVRTASALARRHVVVAPAAALVPDLAAALAAHPPGRAASWSCLITGPSRTADIEKSLVLGAHGPLALDVLVLTEA